MSTGTEAGKKCHETAVRFLAIREHSKFELRQKLKNRGFPLPQIETVLDELESQNLQSDLRFTASLIRVRQSKGYGPVYISNYLREKGVNTGLIESMLDFNDTAWQKALKDAAVKKFGETRPADFREKARRMNFLMRRGFSSQQIRDFFDG